MESSLRTTIVPSSGRPHRHVRGSRVHMEDWHREPDIMVLRRDLSTAASAHLGSLSPQINIPSHSLPEERLHYRPLDKRWEDLRSKRSQQPNKTKHACTRSSDGDMCRGCEAALAARGGRGRGGRGRRRRG